MFHSVRICRSFDYYISIRARRSLSLFLLYFLGIAYHFGRAITIVFCCLFALSLSLGRSIHPIYNTFKLDVIVETIMIRQLQRAVRKHKRNKKKNTTSDRVKLLTFYPSIASNCQAQANDPATNNLIMIFALCPNDCTIAEFFSYSEWCNRNWCVCVFFFGFHWLCMSFEHIRPVIYSLVDRLGFSIVSFVGQRDLRGDVWTHTCCHFLGNLGATGQWLCVFVLSENMRKDMLTG